MVLRGAFSGWFESLCNVLATWDHDSIFEDGNYRIVETTPQPCLLIEIQLHSMFYGWPHQADSVNWHVLVGEPRTRAP